MRRPVRRTLRLPLRRLGCGLLSIGLVALPVRALAQDGMDASLQALMASDARLQTIGWRLARANAVFCVDAPGGAAAGIGLLLLDARSFPDPEAVRRALRLRGDIAVDAVAAGSPAQVAGLRPGDEVLAIAGQRMADLPPVPPSDYRRLADLHARVAQTLASGSGLTLGLRGADGVEHPVVVAGEPACRSRFELSDTGRAVADGERVIVGSRALADNADEGEAAILVAHELAHNILQHRRRLDATGRAAAAVAATEREADRLAVWLAANAGYDLDAGSRFAQGYLRRIDPGLFRKPTHDGWRDRLAVLTAEIEAVRQAGRARPDAPLDWRSRFVPSPLP